MDEGLYRVDLVFLSPDHVVTRFEAVRPNVLVFARPDFDHGSYYSRALREYWDLLPLLKWQREALKERLQRGGPDGSGPDAGRPNPSDR